jgi:hypothetical protein
MTRVPGFPRQGPQGKKTGHASELLIIEVYALCCREVLDGGKPGQVESFEVGD